MPSAPRLSREAILHWAGPYAAQEGRRYLQAGRLSALRRYGSILLALCQGQAAEPYRVRATLDGQSVVSARCTCPAGREGRCKHVAALLWAWHSQPEAFATPTPLAPRLRRLPQPTLVQLIGHLLEHAPHLREVVEAYLANLPPNDPPTEVS